MVAQDSVKSGGFNGGLNGLCGCFMTDPLGTFSKSLKSRRPTGFVGRRVFEFAFIMTVANHAAPKRCDGVIMQANVVAGNGSP